MESPFLTRDALKCITVLETTPNPCKGPPDIGVPIPKMSVRSVPAACHILRQATSDLCWLLDHGYGIASATELVGDRHHLTRRQRIAIARCACSGEAKERRDGHCVAPPQLRGQELWLDGLNVLTAVETALGGGVILIGRDGCCRDVAGIYSHYHKVAETVPALRAIGQLASQWAVTKCHWWLDSPVDNSGRLKGILQEVAS